MKKGKRAGESPIGVDVIEGKSYFWCTCGTSAKQPFCDGSHKGTDSAPLKYLADQTKKVMILRFAMVLIILKKYGYKSYSI